MIRQPPTDLSPEETLDVTLDAVLQRWGRYSWANWDVFAPIVELRLKSVEAQAREWHEADDRGWAVTYYDLCRASWTVIKRAIGALRPADGIIDVFAGQALDRLPQERWPSSTPVPIEAQDYLVLAGQYVWRWTVTQVAELLKVDERTVNTARRRAVKVLARQILAWEATPRLQLDPPDFVTPPYSFGLISGSIETDGTTEEQDGDELKPDPPQR